MTALVRPGLVVSVFAPIGGNPQDAEASAAYLRRRWAVTERLGMEESLRDDLPTDLPDLPGQDEPGFHLLAGRSQAGDGEVRQAFCFARHDVLGISVALASTGGSESPERWGDLARAWRTAIGEDVTPDSILGETSVFTAAVDVRADELAALEPAVASALASAGLGAWGPAYLTAEGSAIWWWRDEAGRRVVTAVAPLEAEDRLSAWSWWQGEHEAAPLLLYGLNAAKLDYEARVHRARRTDVAASLGQIDGRLDAVLGLHAAPELSGRTSLPGLIAAQDQLIGAQAASAQLAIELTHLRALKRTVGIARRNLAALAPAPTPGASPVRDSMFQRDQDLAQWLEDQIDHDVGYADSVVQRSREAQNLTMLRLQQIGTRLTRAQSRVTIMQTSLLGALVAGLGAIAILRLSFEPPLALRAPLLVSFVTLLLAAPVLAAHWFDRFTFVDRLAAMLLGGSLGWLALALAFGEGSTVTVVAAVAIGAATGLGSTLVHDRAPHTSS